MTTMMRAKMEVKSVDASETQERLKFSAVGNYPYPEDGGDEDNTYARWTPSANLEIVIQNPSLFGKFKEGDKFYVDFTKAE